MKKLISLCIISLLLFASCSDLGKGIVPPDQVSKYPASLNSEWEYNYITIIEYYDSTGNIAGADTVDIGNTITRISKMNDSLGTYQNLILFECYNLSTPLNRSRHWYSNSDTGFISIAYSNAGAANTVIPKIAEGKRYLTIEDVKSIY